MGFDSITMKERGEDTVAILRKRVENRGYMWGIDDDTGEQTGQMPKEVAGEFLTGTDVEVASSYMAMGKWVPYKTRPDVGRFIVTFPDGARWTYSPVTKAEARSFLRAGSKGKWNWDHIRVRGTKHKHQKMAAPSANSFCPTGKGGGIKPTCSPGKESPIAAGRTHILTSLKIGDMSVARLHKTQPGMASARSMYHETVTPSQELEREGLIEKTGVVKGKIGIGASYAGPGSAPASDAEKDDPSRIVYRLSNKGRIMMGLLPRETPTEVAYSSTEEYRSRREYLDARISRAKKELDQTKGKPRLEKKAREALSQLQKQLEKLIPPSANSFCPTGEGGGRKPTCSPGGVRGVWRVQQSATGNARKALDAALWNVGIDPDAPKLKGAKNVEPRHLARRLASSWHELHDDFTPDEKATVERAMKRHGMRKIGKAGESVAFDGAIHEGIAGGGVFTGDRVRVSRPGWDRPEEGGAYLVLKARVERLTGNERKQFFADCARDAKGRCMAGGKFASTEDLTAARAKAIEKAGKGPKPTAEEKQEAKEGIAKLGANLYRRNLVGNSADRAKRRVKLLEEFGNGKSCPCVYCGLKLTHKNLEQDKIITTAKGGRYRTPNLIPACGSCNKKRGDTSWEKITWQG
jgi:hypothetical protein